MTSAHASHRAQLLRAATNAAVAVAVTLACIKLGAYWFSGSVALLASAMDSALDAGASLLNAVAVRYALRPPDDGHRFGHGKSESLAGLAQALIIAISGIYVIARAVERLVEPQPLSAAWSAVLVMVVSLALTVALVSFQRYVLRRTDSSAIEADSFHYVSDLASNSAALLALLLARLGWLRADAWLGLAIALVTLYGAWRIAVDSFLILMDHELSAEARAQIQRIVLSHAQIRGLHAMRTRRSGGTTLIQLHVELDPGVTLVAANRVAHEVSSALEAELPGADVIIHTDPADQPCAR